MQRIIWSSVLASLTLAAVATAQVPQPPAGGAVPAVAAAPAAAPTKNLWSCLLLSPEQRANCESMWCRSPLGQLASGAMGPVSGMSGGLIQNHCVANAIKEVLNDPKKAAGAEGAAALIKLDEAEMQARREAVRYLGTVDCSRWPEAEKALADALLKDRSECVRFEAALALQRGCCCTKVVVKALTDCVTGKSDPAEKSERVKNAAVIALSHCVLPAEPSPIKTDEKPEIKKVVAAEESASTDVMVLARKALAQIQAGDGNSGTTTTTAAAPRPGSVSQIFSNALSTPKGSGGSGVSPTDPALGADRKPFFDNLTKALKGPQTAAQPTAIAAAADVPFAPVPVTVVVNTPPPAPAVVMPQTVVVTREPEPRQLPFPTGGVTPEPTNNPSLPPSRR